MAIQMRFAHVFHRRRALWRGARDAFGSPMLVLLAGMIAYGSVAHQHGFNVWITSLGSVFIFAPDRCGREGAAPGAEGREHST